MAKHERTIVVSLGGSLIVPGEVDVEFLRQFRALVLDFIGKGNRVIIVCGGGKVCRNYQKAAQEILETSSANDLDWIGIRATKLNAELVRVIFGDHAHDTVIEDPSAPFDTDKHIIIGAGYLPGHSSDVDAVMLAKNFHADEIINLSNVDHVYEKDPRKFPDALKFDTLTWAEFLDIIGEDWQPGMNAPFDPVASKIARDSGIMVKILSGKDMKNVENALNGKMYEGTTLS